MYPQDHVDLKAQEARPKASKARRRPGAKLATDADKRSLNLRIDVDTYERLTVHAMRRRRTISELVMDLAGEHLREFSIHRHGNGNGKAEG